jgi:hypothetical protein
MISVNLLCPDLRNLSVLADMREYPPQKRMIKKVRTPNLKQPNRPQNPYEAVNVDFPYLQFYYFFFKDSNYKRFQVTGSLKSIYDGGERHALSFPNCSSGSVCLGDYEYANLEEGIFLFWNTKFTKHKIPTVKEMLVNTLFEFWWPKDIKANSVNSGYTWQVLENTGDKNE